MICSKVSASPRAGDRHAREVAVGDVGADHQALDVVAAAREHQRDAHQHAGLVAHEDARWCGRRRRRLGRASRQAVARQSLLDMTQVLPVGLLELVLGRSMIMSAQRRAGRDHREDVVLLHHLGLDHARARRCSPCAALQHAVDVGRRADAQALDAVGLGQLHEVGVALEVDAGQAVVEEQLLPLADHAEVVVVDDQDLDRQLVDRRGGQLAHASSGSRRRRRSPRPSCPGWRTARRSRPGSRSPSCRRRRLTASGGSCVVRQNCAAHIWCWPTSVVTIASPSPSASSRSSTCCARRPPFFGVLERVLLAPGWRLREPLARCRACSTSGSRSSITRRASPARLHVGPDDLVELGRVDVDVDLGRVGAELATACR